MLLFVLLCALWGFSFVAIKYALTALDPLWLAALRLWIAGPLVLLWAAATRRPLKPAGGWGGVALLGVINAGLLNVCLILGLHFVAAGLGSILLYTYPLVAVALAAPFLGERLTARKAAGIACGFLGIVAIAGLSGGAWQGDLAELGGSLLWAIGTLMFKRIVGAHDVIMLAGWTTLFGAAAATLLGAVFEGAPQVHGSALTLAWSLGYIAVPGMAVAWVLWYSLLERGQAGVASAFLFMTPAFALLFGAVVLAEPVTWVKGAGIVLVAAGIYLVNRSARPGRPAPRSGEGRAPFRPSRGPAAERRS